MVAAWTILGVFVGLAIAMPFREGVADALGKVVAGIIVYSLLGAALSLFASRAQESLVGGVCGLCIGLAAELWQPAAPPGQSIRLCLTIGALIGATFWPWLRTLQAVVRHGTWLLFGRPTAK